MTTAEQAPRAAAPLPTEDERRARAALSRLLEPGDGLGALAVSSWGAERSLEVLTGRDRPQAGERQDLAVAVADHGHRMTERTWDSAQQRWSARVQNLSPDRDLETIRRLGGDLLIPGDPAWPCAVDDLGAQSPLALWVRGPGPVPAAGRTAAIVGSRESTAYGQHVTRELATGLVSRGCTVLSGGAYGIDAAAHRAALTLPTSSGAPTTVAVLAGGLDRYYPAGNEQLLREVGETGLLLSEMPPGASPTRYRFLSRNRLIAALSGVVVVVEARWRSGAQNTAGHALTLGREVAAVPGPVTSPASAGCHRLLRDSPAVLVTGAEDVLELMSLGTAPPSGTAGPEVTPVPGAGGQGQDRPHDHLSLEELLVHEALPLRSPAGVDRICSVAGLGTGTVLGVLQRLRRAGLAEQQGQGWRRGTPAE